eukprot:GHVR01174028.1.p1 GENE.GHVR01174028.1~~GHVR01174028.1.p1  ORF type:complete len:238 (+),score=77.44 GHVR01174028.1:1-714(+)
MHLCTNEKGIHKDATEHTHTYTHARKRTHTHTHTQPEFDPIAYRCPYFGSLFVANGDNFMVPYVSELKASHLFHTLFFNSLIRSVGDSYKETLGQRYISAHIRLSDFTRVRPDKVPHMYSAGQQLLDLSKSHKVTVAFVATDGSDEDKVRLLKSAQPLTLKFFDFHWPSQKHPGMRAAAEQWVAATSICFIGSNESTFTREIVKERALLGFSEECSTLEFCGLDTYTHTHTLQIEET